MRPLALVFLVGCARGAVSSPASPGGDAARLVALAESAHHCSGEPEGDAERSADLSRCVEQSLAEARPLLARLPSGSLPPGELAVVRLFVEEALSADEARQLCAQVPAEDFMPGLLDDEARARCGAP